jgi:hypothetical protein
MLWPEDVLHMHPTAAANSAAGAQQAATSSSSAYAVPGSQQQQQQQEQQDHNPIDDSRVLLAFDSMDQPAFGSWKPGGVHQHCTLLDAVFWLPLSGDHRQKMVHWLFLQDLQFPVVAAIEVGSSRRIWV